MDLLRKIELRVATLEVLLQNLYAKYFMEYYHFPILEAKNSLSRAQDGEYHIASLHGAVDENLAAQVKEMVVNFFGNNLSIVTTMQNHLRIAASNEDFGHNAWFKFFDREFNDYSITELSEVEVQSSDLVRRIWINDGHDNKSFIIKELSDNELRKHIVKAYSLFDREICFYRKVAPKDSIAAPKLLDFAVEPPYLILEDLGRYVSGDQEFGYTIEEAKSVIDKMADFHAFWLNDAELKTLPVPRVNNELISSAMPAMLDDAWRKLSNLFNDDLGYDAGYYVKNLINNIKPITEVLCNDKITLLHGDLRLDNVLFEKYEAKCFLDWQMMAIGSPMVDIAYFVSQSGTPECQKDVRDYAFKVYAEKIYNGDTDRIKQEYRNALLFNLSTPIFAALGDVSGNNNVRDIVTEAFSRAMAHIRLEA